MHLSTVSLQYSDPLVLFILDPILQSLPFLSIDHQKTVWVLFNSQNQYFVICRKQNLKNWNRNIISSVLETRPISVLMFIGSSRSGPLPIQTYFHLSWDRSGQLQPLIWNGLGLIRWLTEERRWSIFINSQDGWSDVERSVESSFLLKKNKKLHLLIHSDWL